MQVREATVDDAEAWVAVLRAASPFLVTSPAAIADSIRSPRRLGHAVATVGGDVVGIARLGDRKTDGLVSLQIQVHPDRRRARAGTALLEWACRVDAARFTGIAHEDGLEAARRWGFTIGRQHTISAVDPRKVAPPTNDLGVVDLDTAGPRAVWECFQATALDDPSGLSQPLPYDDFLAEDWDDPVHRPDLGRAVLVDGRVAAVSSILAADDRAWNAYTGTQPSRRGRGLASIAKRAALVATARAGITTCSTGNDSANRPMLAVNQRLGYRPIATTYGVSLVLA
jgi:GNAT superfamily N-acetyltransferase